VFGGELLGRLFGKQDLTIEQHNPSLEIFFRLEIGIAGRVERFDEGNLFGGSLVPMVMTVMALISCGWWLSGPQVSETRPIPE
jgi:hypothetical protein